MVEGAFTCGQLSVVLMLTFLYLAILVKITMMICGMFVVVNKNMMKA